MRKLIPLFVSLIALSYQARQADAAEWSISGGGCVVDSDPQVPTLAAQRGGFVEFVPGTATGAFAINCPITPGNGDVEGTGFALEMYFWDGDGTGGGSSIRADVYRMSFATGATTAVSGCSINSNNGANSTGYQRLLKSCASHNFDRNQYLYFVVVNMFRNSTALVTRFYGLSL